MTCIDTAPTSKDPLLQFILQNNQQWASHQERRDPGFFQKTSQDQSPYVLWIGCSDSRVPPNEITGLGPGHLFVHRNIANLVSCNDWSLLSVVQYAIEYLKVKHILLCGHYGCGGIQAALSTKSFGMLDHWLHTARESLQSHPMLEDLEDKEKWNKAVELNIFKGLVTLGQLPVIKQAWKSGVELKISGWVYDMSNGRLRDLHYQASSEVELHLLETDWQATLFPIDDAVKHKSWKLFKSSRLN